MLSMYETMMSMYEREISCAVELLLNGCDLPDDMPNEMKAEATQIYNCFVYAEQETEGLKPSKHRKEQAQRLADNMELDDIGHRIIDNAIAFNIR